MLKLNWYSVPFLYLCLWLFVYPLHDLLSLSYSLRTLGFAFTCLLLIYPRICSPCREVKRPNTTYTCPQLKDFSLFKWKLMTFYGVKPCTLWTVHAQARVIGKWIRCTSGEDSLPGHSFLFVSTGSIGTTPCSLANGFPLRCMKLVPALLSSKFK